MQLLQKAVATWYQSSWICSLADFVGSVFQLFPGFGTYPECLSEHCAGMRISDA